MRERLNGFLRCAAWRFLRLSFEFSLRARSSAQSRYTLKTTERLFFSADLHFFPSVNFPALELRMPNDRGCKYRKFHLGYEHGGVAQVQPAEHHQEPEPVPERRGGLQVALPGLEKHREKMDVSLR